MTNGVAPFAGAWIEIDNGTDVVLMLPVAPFAGAWIEITEEKRMLAELLSLPSRERGLK